MTFDLISLGILWDRLISIADEIVNAALLAHDLAHA